MSLADAVALQRVAQNGRKSLHTLVHDDAQRPLIVSLIGPEMTDDDGAEERRPMARDVEASAGAMRVEVHAGVYHEVVAGAPPPHLAVVLCGGVDSGFGSWGAD